MRAAGYDHQVQIEVRIAGRWRENDAGAGEGRQEKSATAARTGTRQQPERDPVVVGLEVREWC